MKKKILFVNDEMTMGGVARILNTLLLNLNRDLYDIDLLVLHKHGELLSEIPKDINVISGTKFFNTIDVPLKNCKLNNILNKLILLFYMKTGLIHNKIKRERKKILNKQYDIEFSAKEGFCTIFVSNGDSKKKINWILVDYKQNNYSKNHMALMKNSLKEIDLNIACSKATKESFSTLFETNNVEILHNLMNQEEIKNLSLKEDIILDNNKINLICVARFHKQKGLDRLIKAYSKVYEYYNLIIVGDGELKDELYFLAKSLNVYDKIKWTGILQNPYPLIRASDIFVLPSLYEGYATIVIESFISQTIVLALEVSGIKEQITNDKLGFIIDNDDEVLLKFLEENKNNKEKFVDMNEDIENYTYDNNAIIKQIDRYFNGKEASHEF